MSPRRKKARDEINSLLRGVGAEMDQIASLIAEEKAKKREMRVTDAELLRTIEMGTSTEVGAIAAALEAAKAADGWGAGKEEEKEVHVPELPKPYFEILELMPDGSQLPVAVHSLSDLSDYLDSIQFEKKEIVVQGNGQVRQAGATQAEGEYVERYRRRAEQSLFIFTKGVLGRHFLTPHFHRDTCHFIQACPPYRKLVLMPREHAKTTIVAGGLPAHILIQPAETNIYFPGLVGSDCRILLAGETAGMAQKNLRVVKSVFTENALFRAFWPACCWENERQSPQWNNDGIIVPRANEWPDPSIRAIGVGGAVTGARPNVMIKDDLVSIDAANSEITMTDAIDWHKASRALLDTYEVESGLQSLEFIIGTRWAVYDLYSYIIDNDPSVEVNDKRYHRIVNDGKILWPEKYTMEKVEQLQREHGSMFYLLYMNSADDPELTDFDITKVRAFKFIDGQIVFDEEIRDAYLEKRKDARKERGKQVVEGQVRSKTRTLSELINSRLIERMGGFEIRAA